MSRPPGRKSVSSEAQRERALGAWELVISEGPELDDERWLRIRKALRFKEADLAPLRGRLPGPVRRGARVDLELPLARLRERGIAAELRRREV